MPRGLLDMFWLFLLMDLRCLADSDNPIAAPNISLETKNNGKVDLSSMEIFANQNTNQKNHSSPFRHSTDSFADPFFDDTFKKMFGIRDQIKQEIKNLEGKHKQALNSTTAVDSTPRDNVLRNTVQNDEKSSLLRDTDVQGSSGRVTKFAPVTSGDSKYVSEINKDGDNGRLTDLFGDEDSSQLPPLYERMKVVTEISIQETVDGKTVQRKPTNEELQLIKNQTTRKIEDFHQENEDNLIKPNDIEDLSSFIKVDPNFSEEEDADDQMFSDEDDDEDIKDMSSILRSDHEDMDGHSQNRYDDMPEDYRKFFLTEQKNFKKYKEVKIRISETEGDFPEDIDDVTATLQNKGSEGRRNNGKALVDDFGRIEEKLKNISDLASSYDVKKDFQNKEIKNTKIYNSKYNENTARTKTDRPTNEDVSISSIFINKENRTFKEDTDKMVVTENPRQDKAESTTEEILPIPDTSTFLIYMPETTTYSSDTTQNNFIGEITILSKDVKTEGKLLNANDNFENGSKNVSEPGTTVSSTDITETTTVVAESNTDGLVDTEEITTEFNVFKIDDVSTKTNFIDDDTTEGTVFSTERVESTSREELFSIRDENIDTTTLFNEDSLKRRDSIQTSTVSDQNSDELSTTNMSFVDVITKNETLPTVFENLQKNSQPTEFSVISSDDLTTVILVYTNTSEAPFADVIKANSETSNADDVLENESPLSSKTPIGVIKENVELSNERNTVVSVSLDESLVSSEKSIEVTENSEPTEINVISNDDLTTNILVYTNTSEAPFADGIKDNSETSIADDVLENNESPLSSKTSIGDIKENVELSNENKSVVSVSLGESLVPSEKSIKVTENSEPTEYSVISSDDLTTTILLLTNTSEAPFANVIKDNSETSNADDVLENNESPLSSKTPIGVIKENVELSNERNTVVSVSLGESLVPSEKSIKVTENSEPTEISVISSYDLTTNILVYTNTSEAPFADVIKDNSETSNADNVLENNESPLSSKIPIGVIIENVELSNEHNTVVSVSLGESLVPSEKSIEVTENSEPTEINVISNDDLTTNILVYTNTSEAPFADGIKDNSETSIADDVLENNESPLSSKTSIGDIKENVELSNENNSVVSVSLGESLVPSEKSIKITENSEPTEYSVISSDDLTTTILLLTNTSEAPFANVIKDNSETSNADDVLENNESPLSSKTPIGVIKENAELSNERNTVVSVSLGESLVPSEKSIKVTENSEPTEISVISSDDLTTNILVYTNTSEAPFADVIKDNSETSNADNVLENNESPLSSKIPIGVIIENVELSNEHNTVVSVSLGESLVPSEKSIEVTENSEPTEISVISSDDLTTNILVYTNTSEAPFADVIKDNSETSIADDFFLENNESSLSSKTSIGDIKENVELSNEDNSVVSVIPGESLVPSEKPIEVTKENLDLSTTYNILEDSFSGLRLPNKNSIELTTENAELPITEESFSSEQSSVDYVITTVANILDSTVNQTDYISQEKETTTQDIGINIHDQITISEVFSADIDIVPNSIVNISKSVKNSHQVSQRVSTESSVYFENKNGVSEISPSEVESLYNSKLEEYDYEDGDENESQGDMTEKNKTTDKNCDNEETNGKEHNQNNGDVVGDRDESKKNVYGASENNEIELGNNYDKIEENMLVVPVTENQKLVNEKSNIEHFEGVTAYGITKDDDSNIKDSQGDYSSVAPILSSRILNNSAKLSIKIVKDDVFYVPPSAYVREYENFVNITWRSDEILNNSVVLRIFEQKEFYMIKEIQLHLVRGNLLFTQQKMVAFSPDPVLDESLEGRTRVVMMRDGTYIFFSNVDFLMKNMESEAALRAKRLWHIELATICLTIVAIVAVALYVIARKTKLKVKLREKDVPEVTHC